MIDPTSRARRLTAVAATTLLAASCMTSGRVAKMGDEEAVKVEQSMGLIAQQKTVDYVVAIGERLAAQSEQPEGPWFFKVVDTPEPNAFALPGGHIYVSRGLLALVNSEDELAGVIGHEIGHVTARHTQKRLRATIATSPVAIATGIGGAAAGIVSPGLGNIVAGTGQLFSAGLIAPFGRAQENEADGIGQELAARAGYDPAGISTFLHSLDRETTLLTGEERKASFLDTHPMTPDRVEKTRETATNLPRAAGQPIALATADVFARLDGLVVGDDPAHGLFQEQLFLHPELDLAISFPEDWKTQNTAAAVGAVSPSQEAVIVLRIAENDTELDAVVERLETEQKDLSFERSEINGLPAVHTVVTGRSHVADVTLIGFGGNVYSITGQAQTSKAPQHMKAFDTTASSFRPLRSSERRSIEESRLRVGASKSGEDAAAVAKRTGTSWSAEALAVANGVEADSKLAPGRLLKLAIPQPYTPRSK